VNGDSESEVGCSVSGGRLRGEEEVRRVVEGGIHLGDSQVEGKDNEK
jgi:hypothetical protein